MTNNTYIGRFAPSPTGPLHFGSLIAAICSYAQARHQKGKWLVRIEDIDQPRCSPSATKLILDALDTYGMHWDDSVTYQSQRSEYYQAALEQLNKNQLTYGCACTRKQLSEQSSPISTPSVYPGTCREGLKKGEIARSIRLRTHHQKVSFQDRIQGNVSQDIYQDVGDFIIKRADNIFAYQLAVVVDDHEQKITEVVRGSDMLDSTPRQIFLQQCLSYSTPDYIHIPLAINADGSKLSKQTHARAIPLNDPRPMLISALTFLCQHPPPELRESNIESIWGWIIEHWSLKSIPTKLGIIYNDKHE